MSECSRQALPTLLSPSKRGEAKNHSAKQQAACVPASKKPDPFCLKVSDTHATKLQECICELVGKLKSRDVATRYQAAEALASLGADAQSARSALATTLLRDDSVHVRKSAARALGELGDKAAQRILQVVRERDEDKFVRYRAKEALELLNLGVISEALHEL